MCFRIRTAARHFTLRVSQRCLLEAFRHFQLCLSDTSFCHVELQDRGVMTAANKERRQITDHDHVDAS